jgi:hypothetical protein
MKTRKKRFSDVLAMKIFHSCHLSHATISQTRQAGSINNVTSFYSINFEVVTSSVGDDLSALKYCCDDQISLTQPYFENFPF